MKPLGNFQSVHFQFINSGVQIFYFGVCKFLHIHSFFRIFLQDYFPEYRPVIRRRQRSSPYHRQMINWGTYHQPNAETKGTVARQEGETTEKKGSVKIKEKVGRATDRSFSQFVISAVWELEHNSRMVLEP